MGILMKCLPLKKWEQYMLKAMLVLPLTTACNSLQQEYQNTRESAAVAQKAGTVGNVSADTTFVDMASVSNDIILDMRYATPDNFLGSAVYPCARCLLRREVANALQQASLLFLQQGYRLKLYDCYRPLEVQKKMWAVMPNDQYVANPYTTGSIHNRGAAVDLTLVDASGKELDMGTAFDYFGKEAHHDYQNLPDRVLANRRLLRKVLETVGFKALETEWWHYLYGEKEQYPLANVSLCD